MQTAKGRSGNSAKERYNTSSRGAAHERCDVTEVESGLVSDVIERVTSAGDCMMWSRTSDGGALHIRILSEGTVAKWYPSSATELVAVLEGIRDDLTDPEAV